MVPGFVTHRGVDPRGCGGDSQGQTPTAQRQGRSPRVRGRPPPACGRSSHSGSIPAGAGETLSHTIVTHSGRVDPRGCGGDPAGLTSEQWAGGRSPRVRGRLEVDRIREADAGSIPAGAGETPICAQPTSAPRVDPRGCGGDGMTPSRADHLRGRSPRVRGRPSTVQRCAFRSGSIPAGAGETAVPAFVMRCRRVDPRGCGGDRATAAEEKLAQGRSPRVRGRRNQR